MIGGKIRQVYRRSDRMSVWVVDDNGDELVIDVERDDNKKMLRGDSIWWQDRIALWTAQTPLAVQDVHIPRIGYTYSTQTLFDNMRELCKAGICPDCGYDECMHDGEGQLWCPRCDGSYDSRE